MVTVPSVVGVSVCSLVRTLRPAGAPRWGTMLRNASGDLKQLAKGILHVARHGTPDKQPGGDDERRRAGSRGRAADDAPPRGGGRARLRLWLEKAEQVLLPLPYDRDMPHAGRAAQQPRTKTRGRQRKERIFEYYDGDNDGVLSFDELAVLAGDIHLEFHPDAPALHPAELEAQVQEILQQIDIHQDHCVGRWNGTVEFDQFEPWLQDQELRYLQLQPRPRRVQTAAASPASPCLRLDALRSRMNLSRWRRITLAVAPILAAQHDVSTSFPYRFASSLPRSRSHDNLQGAAADVDARAFDERARTQTMVRSVSCDALLAERRGAGEPQDTPHDPAATATCRVHSQRSTSHSSSHMASSHMARIISVSPRLRQLPRDSAKPVSKAATVCLQASSPSETESMFDHAGHARLRHPSMPPPAKVPDASVRTPMPGGKGAVQHEKPQCAASRGVGNASGLVAGDFAPLSTAWRNECECQSQCGAPLGVCRAPLAGVGPRERWAVGRLRARAHQGLRPTDASR